MKIASTKSLNLTCILIVFFTQILLAYHLQNFSFLSDGKIRYLPILLSTFPALLLFITLRFIAPLLASTIITTSLLIVLSIANNIKISLTNDPLSWSDVSSTANVSVISHYLSPTHIIILTTFILVLVIAWIVNPQEKCSKRTSGLRLAAFILLATTTFNPYADMLDKRVGLYISGAAENLGISYISWDWPLNIERNGLPLHLVQTSRRRVPPAPSPSQIAEFEKLVSYPTTTSKRAETIIFILCEACWHDEKHFKQPFEKLTTLGFQEARVISPVYGGSTVNATFELLTGLPANGALNGVIYQEYADIISKSAHTLPRYLKKQGYQTTEAHNHGRRFWRRDIVSSKLGFDEFIGLEDMGHTISVFWADDAILFDHALNILKKNTGPQFLFLTTVSTHGPYFFDGDYGERNYADKLSIAMDRISRFITQVDEILDDTMIVIVGDHKPALNKYFFEEKVLPRDQFESIGSKNEDFSFATNSSQEIRGDVPSYVRLPTRIASTRLAEQIHGKPFFCLSQILNDETLKLPVPAFVFSQKNNICENYKTGDYEKTISMYPDWLYSISILK